MEELLKDKAIAIDQAFSNVQITQLEAAIWKLGGRVVDKKEDDVIDYYVVEKITKDLDGCIGVTPSWIYMLQKHLSWVEPRSFSPLTEKIMSGFRVWVMNNVSKSDRAVIYACVEHLGGSPCFEKETKLTHAVTDEYDPIVDVLLKHGVKVVVPEYFGDCFRLGMVCPPRQYMFPEVAVRNYDLKDLIANALPKYEKPMLVAPDPNLFAGKLFFVDSVLYNVNDSKPLWLDNIETLGGKIVRKIEFAKTLITEIRGKWFAKAMELGIEIGTKRWIRDQIKSNTLTPPLAAVLHYPYPLGEVEGMNSCVISVTNYVGDPREDIASMAKRMGAKFTRNLSKENTHIICGDCKGEKFARAKDWNLHTVNHIWLEESYAKWQYQREGKERYTCFPSCLNEMVNKTHVLDQKGMGTTYTVKRKAEDKLNTDFVKNNGQCSSQNKLISGHSKLEAALDEKVAVEKLDDRPKATLKDEFNVKAEKSSLMKTKLEDNSFGLLPVQEEVGKLKRKTSKPEIIQSEGNIETKALIVAFTGLRLLPEEEEVFNSMNIRTTDNIAIASVLVAEKISRTEKFLLAISLSIPIVSTAWKDQVIDGVIQPMQNYLLSDPDGEKALDFSLKKSVKISKESNILKGKTIYCTASVQPPKITIANLVEANGGDFGELITRRNVQRIKDEIECLQGDVICLSTASDTALIEKLGRNCYSTEWLLNSILRQETKGLEEYQLNILR